MRRIYIEALVLGIALHAGLRLFLLVMVKSRSAMCERVFRMGDAFYCGFALTYICARERGLR